MTVWLGLSRLRRFAAPVFVAAIVASPLPALAADDPSPAPPPSPLTLLFQANTAAATLAPALKAHPAHTQAPSPAPATPDRGSWSFFKSPGGIIVLSTLAVGVGYFIYSTQNDRVNSPGKQ